MNNKNISAYNTKPEHTNPRDVEAWALLESARDMAKVMDSHNDLGALRNAVRANMILWTVFQDAVLDDSSPLPFEIRQNLLNLSRFVDKHTLEILATEDFNKLNILIDINKNIAAGLLQTIDDQPSLQNDDIDSAVPTETGTLISEA